MKMPWTLAYWITQHLHQNLLNYSFQNKCKSAILCESTYYLFVFWKLVDFLKNTKQFLLLSVRKKNTSKLQVFSCIEKCLAISQQKSTPNVPVVMTTPARTFRRAWGEVKLSVSSLNLSTTRRDTASARTWNQIHKHTCEHTDTSLCHIRHLQSVLCYLSLEHHVPVTVSAFSSKQKSEYETATSESRLTPWGIPYRLSSNAVWA